MLLRTTNTERGSFEPPMSDVQASEMHRCKHTAAADHFWPVQALESEDAFFLSTVPLITIRAALSSQTMKLDGVCRAMSQADLKSL